MRTIQLSCRSVFIPTNTTVYTLTTADSAVVPVVGWLLTTTVMLVVVVVVVLLRPGNPLGHPSLGDHIKMRRRSSSHL